MQHSLQTFLFRHSLFRFNYYMSRIPLIEAGLYNLQLGVTYRVDIYFEIWIYKVWYNFVDTAHWWLLLNYSSHMDGDNNTLTCRWLLNWFWPNRALKHTPDGIDGIFFSNWHILLLARISFFAISNKQFKNQLWVCGFKPLNIVVVYKSYGTFVPSFHHWWTTEIYCYFTIIVGFTLLVIN